MSNGLFWLFCFFAAFDNSLSPLGLSEVPNPLPEEDGSPSKNTYSKLLQLKRKEQSAAIQALLKAKEAKKRSALLQDLVARMGQVLAESRHVLEGLEFDSSNKWPIDELLREHVARVIENAAFFGETALYLPSFVHAYLAKHPEQHALFKWAHLFATNFDVFDEATRKMMHLAAQELRIVDREEHFVNPYSKREQKEAVQRRELDNLQKQQQEEAKRRTSSAPKKRGPGISRSDL